MNMMRIFYIGLSGVGMMFSSMASGHDAGGLQSPACGVVCDPYICVNSDGISPELTRKYLGEKAAENLQSLKATIPANLHSLTVYFAMLKKNYVVMIVILVWMVSGVEKSIKSPQRCYLCVVSDALFTLCSIRHCLLFVINLLSDREEWGVNVYDGESPRRLTFT